MTPVSPCPKCRGYDLERRWCGLCGGRGVVESGRRDMAAEVFRLLREGK